MKTWDRPRFSLSWSEPQAAVSGRHWFRLRGDAIEYFGGPSPVPVLANPKLHPAIKLFWQVSHNRKLAAYNLERLDRQPGIRLVNDKRTVMQMAQAIDQPTFYRRPQDPSDHVRGMFPNGVSFMPARQPSVEADITPHLQYAGISGGFLFAIVFMIFGFGIYLQHWNGEWYLYDALLALLIATAYAWRQWEVSTSRARVTWWAMETAVNQDLDGDGFIGEPIKPRLVPVIHNDKTEYINMEDVGGLYASEWREVAIALLVKHGNVSRRGIYDNCSLSQSKSSEAVKILEQGYTSEDKSINRAGYDFLIHYLPEHLSPTIPRPTE